MKLNDYVTTEHLKIAVGETWQTRRGVLVRIIAIQNRPDPPYGHQPIIGLFPDDEPETWHPTGQYTAFGALSDGTSGRDLVERVSEAPAASELFVIWSNKHRMWWRADSCGYTWSFSEAGIYSRGEAMAISGRAGFINGNRIEPPSCVPMRHEDAAMWVAALNPTGQQEVNT